MLDGEDAKRNSDKLELELRFFKKKRLELRLVSRAALASHSHRQRIASFRDEHLSI